MLPSPSPSLLQPISPRPPLLINPVPPPLAPDDRRPRRQRARQQEQGRNGAEPAHADVLDRRQHHRRPEARKQVPHKVVARNHVAAPPLHDVEAVRVEAGEAEQLRDALHKERDDDDRDPAHVLVHAPAVDEHARGDHAAEEGQRRPQAVLGHPRLLLGDVLLDHVVGVAAAEEGAEQVARPRGQVEEAGLHRGREVEAGVQDVADGREEGVHVPDQGGGRETVENADQKKQQQRGSN